MSLVDCGSVDLSNVGALSVDLGEFGGIGDNPCEVKLANESPFTLQVTIDSNQHTLAAWMVDKFPLCGKTHFALVASQIQTPAQGSIPSKVLLITVAPEGETIPGTYPASLSRLTNSQISNWTQVGSKQLALGADFLITSAVPSSTKTLGMLIESAGTGIDFQGVLGVDTGGEYTSTTTRRVIQWLMIPVNGAIDSFYEFLFANGFTKTVHVFASDVPQPVITPGQSVMSDSMPVAISADQSRIPTIPDPYDASGVSNPAGGVQASIVLAAVAGKRYVLAMIAASTLNNAAGINNSVLQVLDGVTQIWALRMDTIAGAGNSSRILESDLALPGTLGASMTVQFTAGIANIFQTLSAGAFLRSS